MGLEEFPTFKKIYINTIKLFKDIINNPKAILNYCFRVAIFLVLMRRLILFSIYHMLFSPYLNSHDLGAFDGPDTGSIIFVGISIYCFIIYFYAKICGLFKKLDTLNAASAFCILFLVDILCAYTFSIFIQIKPIKFSFTEPCFVIILPFLFLIYKFFNYLSKKYTFFQKIGYYFSAEFYKDLYLRLKR